ncbi:MAG: hypothetical protein GC184_08735 [Rhizobiales bacterium]|nr:hypothetical protein [Hyphomicrobiales bacterium]
MGAPLAKYPLIAACVMGVAFGMTMTSHRVMAADTTDINALVASLEGLDFASKVAALMAAYPDGGDDFEEALTMLAVAEPDPAKAAAILMVSLGDTATPGKIDGVIRTIDKLGNYTPEQIRLAVKEAVLNAADPVAAARGVLSAVPDLNQPNQLALGYGLGDAAVALRARGDTLTASVIVIEVTTSRMSVLVKSFEETTKTTIAQTTTTKTNSTVNTQTGKTPENKASDS